MIRRQCYEKIGTDLSSSATTYLASAVATVRVDAHVRANVQYE